MDLPMLTTDQAHELLADCVNERIELVESAMLELDQVEIPVKESYANGMYTRQIMIPRGTLLTGRVHMFPYVDIMLAGDIEVATPDGIKHMTGWNVLQGFAGRKRIGYAWEDTYWATVHRTDQFEPGAMEELLTFPRVGDWKQWFDAQVARLEQQEVIA